MFGYVKPFKPELKIKEFDTYQAVYCGLCHQLGKTFGPFAKLTLSYDFTFMALMSLALKEEFCGFKKTVCMANPLKKKNCCVPSQETKFVGACAMMLFYYKLKDNILDSVFYKKLLYYPILPFASFARKKALKFYPELDSIFSNMMKSQITLEKQKEESIDKASEPTAKALETAFSMLSDNEKQTRVLSRFGYLLGRWVYLLDALDDLKSDDKKGNYNAFLVKFKVDKLTDDKHKEILEYGKGALNITTAELANSYELLELYRYKSILDNIIYLGLKKSAETVLDGGI